MRHFYHTDKHRSVADLLRQQPEMPEGSVDRMLNPGIPRKPRPEGARKEYYTEAPAAKFLGMKPHELAWMRRDGSRQRSIGPKFHMEGVGRGAQVKYALDDLEDWKAKRDAIRDFEREWAGGPVFKKPEGIEERREMVQVALNQTFDRKKSKGKETAEPGGYPQINDISNDIVIYTVGGKKLGIVYDIINGEAVLGTPFPVE